MCKLINAGLIVLNIICIIVGSFYDTCWSSWVVCIISTILFVLNTVLNNKLNEKVKNHEQALTIGGDDVE